MEAVCQGILLHFPHIRWACQSRVSSVQKDGFLPILKKAGCEQIGFGMESGSPKILTYLKNNRVTVEQNQKAVDACKKTGIRTFASFMIGSPGETRQDMEMTVDFILASGLDDVEVMITTPYPGSRLWKDCEERGLINRRFTWDMYNTAPTGVSASDLFSGDEIKEIYRDINCRIDPIRRSWRWETNGQRAQ